MAEDNDDTQKAISSIQELLTNAGVRDYLKAPASKKENAVRVLERKVKPNDGAISKLASNQLFRMVVVGTLSSALTLCAVGGGNEQAKPEDAVKPSTPEKTAAVCTENPFDPRAGAIMSELKPGEQIYFAPASEIINKEPGELVAYFNSMRIVGEANLPGNTLFNYNPDRNNGRTVAISEIYMQTHQQRSAIAALTRHIKSDLTNSATEAMSDVVYRLEENTAGTAMLLKRDPNGHRGDDIKTIESYDYN